MQNVRLLPLQVPRSRLYRVQAFAIGHRQRVTLYKQPLAQRQRSIDQCLGQTGNLVVSQVGMLKQATPFKALRHHLQTRAIQMQLAQPGKLVETQADRTQRVATQVQRAQVDELRQGPRMGRRHPNPVAGQAQIAQAGQRFEPLRNRQQGVSAQVQAPQAREKVQKTCRQSL